MTRPSRPGNVGFTLIEVVVVVSLMGLVAAVLAAVFTTVIRTAPTAEDRIDGARSFLGLTTWLPQDVSSASPTSFATNQPSSSCAGVPTSEGLLELRWVAGGTTLVADYRFVLDPDGETGKIVRFACSLGGPASSIRMTAGLVPIPGPSPAPVNITRDGSPGAFTGVRFEVLALEDDGVTTRSILALVAETTNLPTVLLPRTTPVGTTTTTTTPATTTTTTLVSGGPTTTTIAATTTTLAACSASFDATPVAPSSGAVDRRGHLEQNVVVTVVWSGACGPLVLSFDPDSTDDNSTPQQLAFNAGSTLTIAKTDYVWRRLGLTPWTITLELREGANGPLRDSASLTIGQP